MATRGAIPRTGRGAVAWRLPRGVRTLAHLAAVAALVLLAAGAAMAIEGGPSRPDLRAAAGGAVRLSNSKAGQAIVSANGLVPGQSTSGTIQIGNDGEATTGVELSASAVRDAPGPNGGRLSQALDLRVEELTAAGAPALVYQGPLDRLPEVSLGAFSPGRARTYRFTVTLPDTGVPPSATTGDNAFQGSSVAVDYRWTTADASAAGADTELALADPEVALAGGVLRRGLRIRVRCPTDCVVTSRLLLGHRDAQRLGLVAGGASTRAHAAAATGATAGALVVGRTTLRIPGGGERTLTVRLYPRARRAIRRATWPITLTLHGEVRSPAGALQRTLEKAIVLRPDPSDDGPTPVAPATPAAPAPIRVADGASAPAGGAGAGARPAAPTATAPRRQADSRNAPLITARTVPAPEGPIWPWIAAAAALAAFLLLLARRRRRDDDEEDPEPSTPAGTP